MSAKAKHLGLAAIAVLVIIGCFLTARWAQELSVSGAPAFEGKADAAADANVKPDCEGSLQAMVDQAAPGSVVVAPGGCVYRQAVTIRKPLTLKASPGAEIRGSDLWAGWEATDGGRWVSRRVVPPLAAHPDMSANGRCARGTSRCERMAQVFLDGRPLEEVGSDPQGGQFALDPERRVVLADDPADRRVEVSVRQHWVRGASDGVTVEGFAMKHAANSGQTGALTNDGFSDWTVRANDLSWAHGPTRTSAAGVAICWRTTTSTTPARPACSLGDPA